MSTEDTTDTLKYRLSEEFIQKLKTKIMKRPKISKEVSLERIKTMIQEDYELTSNRTYLEISVNCPLTTARLVVPVKYSTCTHPHCFELEAFIRLVQTSNNFCYTECPICRSNGFLKDLAINELFMCLLHSGDKNGVTDLNARNIKIYESGEWEWEKCGKNLEEAILELVDDDDKNQMERLKLVKVETKTKSYSKESHGTTEAQQLDPATRARENLKMWLMNSIAQLKLQLDQFKTEVELIMAGKEKKLGEDKQDRLYELKISMKRHKFHISKLETLMRMVDKLFVNVNAVQLKGFLNQVMKIKEDIEHYIESESSSHEPEFEETEFLYDGIEGLEREVKGMDLDLSEEEQTQIQGADSCNSSIVILEDDNDNDVSNNGPTIVDLEDDVAIPTVLVTLSESSSNSSSAAQRRTTNKGFPVKPKPPAENNKSNLQLQQNKAPTGSPLAYSITPSWITSESLNVSRPRNKQTNSNQTVTSSSLNILKPSCNVTSSNHTVTSSSSSGSKTTTSVSYSSHAITKFPECKLCQPVRTFKTFDALLDHMKALHYDQFLDSMVRRNKSENCDNVIKILINAGRLCQICGHWSVNTYCLRMKHMSCHGKKKLSSDYMQKLNKKELGMSDKGLKRIKADIKKFRKKFIAKTKTQRTTQATNFIQTARTGLDLELIKFRQQQQIQLGISSSHPTYTTLMIQHQDNKVATLPPENNFLPEAYSEYTDNFNCLDWNHVQQQQPQPLIIQQEVVQIAQQLDLVQNEQQNNSYDYGNDSFATLNFTRYGRRKYEV